MPLLYCYDILLVIAERNWYQEKNKTFFFLKKNLVFKTFRLHWFCCCDKTWSPKSACGRKGLFGVQFQVIVCYWGKSRQKLNWKSLGKLLTGSLTCKVYVEKGNKIHISHPAQISFWYEPELPVKTAKHRHMQGHSARFLSSGNKNKDWSILLNKLKGHSKEKNYQGKESDLRMKKHIFYLNSRQWINI